MISDAVDLRTVFLMVTFVSTTTAMALMFLWRSHPDERSLPVWALGALLVAAGYMGIALRSWTSPFVSIPLANACVTTGHACFLVGIDRLTGRKPASWPSVVALGLAVIASLSYFTYVQSSTAVRMAIQFVAIGLLSLATARRLLATGDPQNRMPHQAAAAIFMSYGLILLVRVGLMPLDAPGDNLFAPNAVHQVVFVVMLLFYAALMYCLPALLFAKETSQRRLTEAALRSSQDDYQSILKITPDGFWVVGPDGRLLAVNDSYTRQSGYSRAELLALSITDLEAMESAEATASHIQHIMQAGSDQFETMHRRKDGSTWSVEVTAIYLASNGGRFFGFCRDISERKRADAAILEARNQLQATLQAIPDLLFEMDLDGRYHAVYATNRDLLAAPIDQLLTAQTVHDILPAEAAATVLSVLREAHDKGQSHGRHIQLPLPQGHSWFELSVAKKPAEPGQEPRFVVLSRDITERKRAESELRIHAERLKEAQRIAQIGSWTLDLISGELIWSDEIFRLFEIDPSQFGATYEAFLDAVHPDDRDAVNQAYTESLKTRRRYEITHRLRMRDGRIKWVQEQCVSEFDAAGEPLRSLGTVQDVTQRKEAEIDLRIAAATFETQQGIVITDAGNVILRVNRAFTESTGYSPEDVVGQSPRLLKSDRHDDQFYRDMWDSIRRTGQWQGEIWDRRKNGEIYPKWLTISAVRDENGVVTHYVGTHHDITERKKAEEKIAALAFFDQLTGLPNRTLLMDRLRQAVTASSRNGSYGALLFLDLDKFKILNDTLGHDMGDLLLQQVAQRLTTCVRTGDTVARLGGDEFVVMLASLSATAADAATHTEAVGEKILAVLNQPYQLRDVGYQSTPSIGATLFIGDDTEIEVLLKQADLAMYKAKDAGRNALRFFDPDMEIAVMKRAALENDLRVAVQEEQFLLHYQAQMAGGRLTGSEALVRWQHPRRGLVSPADFISLAEETGLILPLGRWVLETACKQLAAWAARPQMVHLTLAVNVSAHQFRQPDFVAQVLTVLENTGANPQLLKLELTESLLVSDVEQLVEKMFALKAKGVGFSLDDFGTGYSSLSYLKRLPLDQLKIDQSFVRDVLTDPNDAAIARTVIALAQNLGLGVIAEGVETEAQKDFLASSGCHAYQGHFFSRPLPIDGFEQFAQESL